MTPAHAAAHINLFHGSPLDVISSCLRGMLIASEGHVLMAADFANIEGRGLAWLAGEEWKLDAFRDFDAGVGPDLYLVAAAKMYKMPIERLDNMSPERQTGKVSELSLGFGGGLGAFRQMEKSLGLKLGLTDDEVNEGKVGWREAHPKIADYDHGLWAKLDEAAIAAVLRKGATTTVHLPGGQPVKYKVKGSFLWCLLPSGRPLCYPYPKIMPVTTPWGAERDALTYMTVVSQDQKMKAKVIPDPAGKGEWQRVSTYGGKLAENVTQAVCRDILKEKMEACDAAGFDIVLHVHDEVVIEVPEDAPEGTLDEFCKLCSGAPDWAEGLPVVAAGWSGKRYRKG